MKVMFLCAGRGKRLKKLTEDKPKCLLTIGGEVLMGRWLKRFQEWKVSDVLINLNYRVDKVLDFLKECDCNGMRLSLYKERNLLGSARTINENRKFVKGDYYFGIVYSDLWTTFDMRKMITFHKRRAGIATIALHEPNTFEGKGVVTTRDGIVTGFHEKSKNEIKSKFVWAGMMVAHPSIFREYDPSMKDIATDFLPALVKTGKVNAFYLKEPVYDIGGSVEEYNRVNEEVKGLGFSAL